MKFLYSSIISFLDFCLPIFSWKIFGHHLYNSKQQDFYFGRKKNIKIIKNNKFHVFRSLKSSVIWLHCSSLGEFEQSRPLIKKIKKLLPKYKIALTFFSPSGYNVMKDYPLVDWIGYLPLDVPKHMDSLVKFINPKILILSKNEFWPNMLYCLKQNRIPVISISSRFNSYNIFWKSWAVWFLKAIKTIDHFYITNNYSKEILNQNGIFDTTVVGDTKMDRVLNILNEKKELKILDNFLKNKECWIAGSTWDEDYFLFMNYIHKDESPKVIIAPHDCNSQSISLIAKKLNVPYALWSNYSYENDHLKKILIIDTIGVLKNTYRYAKWAYIGGGMGRWGLHNILEAAVYDLPIIIGKNYMKFPEAIDLIKKGGCFSVSSRSEFEKVVKNIYNELNFTKIINSNYIKEQQGATEKIFIGLKKILVEA